MLFILPAVILLAILAAVAAFFYFSRTKPRVWGTGVTVLLLYALMMTWTAWKAGHEQNYFLRVSACDDRHILGQTDDGKSVRLTFPSLQNRLGGESPEVKTINAAGEQNNIGSNAICQMFSEQQRDATIRFETNGLKQIQRIWFLPV
jgi:hypothetical protein